MGKLTSHIVHLTRFLRGKTIAVVGNGEMSNLGVNIDSHDVIIRFNNYVLKGFEKHVGTRTTVWAHSRTSDVKNRKAYRDGFIFEFATRPQVNFCKDWEKKVGCHRSELPLTIMCPVAFSKLKYKSMSSGIYVLNYLHFNNLPFSTFGFDFFKSGHYFEDSMRYCHNPTQEELEFRRLTQNK